ncbi:MAG: DUF1269 domain-containing protein [Arenimonas sp.]|uniref:hypothetical protein n=1 Tax=Arenimonas sp. TaxID=1872635 RepID=UPI0025BE7578|nr:hypothetical protein [Arenimonas sp.]MBW8368964.1 DUF1269 domain-containing protein [Arenimonas sp.]
MKSRYVYRVESLPRLTNAMDAARSCGVTDDDLAVVARHDIELRIDPDTPEPEAHGQLTGLLAGLSAVTVPTLGVSIAGAGLINLIGNAMGGWVPALAGDTVDDEVRRRFSDEVEAGGILLVVDATPELHARVDAALRDHGATPIDTGTN